MDRFFPGEKIVKTGNPVRSNLVKGHENTREAYDYFGLDPDKATLLVLGGSLGARRINELIASELAFFSGFGMQIIWQCGKLYYEVYRDYDSGSVKVREFVNRMDYAYSVADIIISRAGAGTVSELCLAGKPVILIPSPNVAENHQTRNAEALGNRDAALMIAEKDLKTSFEKDFKALFLSADRRKTLGTNIRKLAIPDATERIVDEIEKLLP
jgi:UDP-N-acetylglucosamine--N-acetylmuramyl-(pentapeptide) pyrophosphoryl-undecaprenol N-acetylglucosamine transferase